MRALDFAVLPNERVAEATDLVLRPIDLLESTMVSVSFPLFEYRDLDLDPYWNAATAAQTFFGSIVPQRQDFLDAVQAFRTEVLRRYGVIYTCATLLLDESGAITLSGHEIETSGGPAVKVSMLSSQENILRYPANWQRYSLATNSHAEVDAFSRHIVGQGFADAVEVNESGELVRPVLGALLVRTRQGTSLLEATTSAVPQFGALAEIYALDRFGLSLGDSGKSSVIQVSEIESCAWFDPFFERHDVTQIGHQTVPETFPFGSSDR